MNLRERLAENAHISWAGWTQYVFNTCTENPDGSLTIPADKVNRWKRQIETPYNKLSYTEQESDRTEADIILDIFNEKIDDFEPY